MPRRRTKASPRHPALEFLASPVNKGTGRPSPVFCAENPVTADVITLEAHDATWVSPQFRKVPDDDRPKRRTKRHLSAGACHTMATRARHRSGSRTPSKATQMRLMAKYKPLSFSNDQEECSISSSSAAESIDPEECGNGLVCRDARISTSSSSSSSKDGRAKSSSSEEARTPGARGNSGLDSMLDTGKIMQKQADRAKCLGSDSDKESPMDTTALRPITNKKVSRPTRQLFSNEEPECKQATRLRGRNVKGRPTRMNFNSPSPPPVCESGPIESAAKAHSPPEMDQDFTIPFQADLSVNTPTYCDPIAPVANEKENADPEGSADYCTSPVFKQTPLNQRLTRLRVRPIVSRDSPAREIDFGPVLAYDTPEEDYGLSIAERNRKYHSKKPGARKRLNNT